MLRVTAFAAFLLLLAAGAHGRHLLADVACPESVLLAEPLCASCTAPAAHSKAKKTAPRCASCIEGYVLVDGACELEPEVPSPTAAPARRRLSTVVSCPESILLLEPNCIECTAPAAHSKAKKTAPRCSACAEGFLLINGVCEVDDEEPAPSPTLAPARRRLLAEVACPESVLLAEPLCASCTAPAAHSKAKKTAPRCASCIEGFELVEGVCELVPTDPPAPSPTA